MESVKSSTASRVHDMVRVHLCGPRRRRRGREEGPELARVTLARESRGKAFGARIVDTETREFGMMISRISEEGALSEWNARNPSRSVAPGDSIVDVNGLTAPWAIMEEMSNAMTVEMVVRRAPPGASAQLARCAAGVTDQSVQTIALLLKRTVRACDIVVDTCSICLEDVEADERVAGLQCGHGFHQKCIMKWLARPGVSGCPLCRGAVCSIDDKLCDLEVSHS
jgi:hypothetical protein